MATAQSSVTVPHDAEAAVLVGRDQHRYGVLSAHNGEIRVLPFAEADADVLANIAVNMRVPRQDAAAFLRELPARLRWLSWAMAVQPGETIKGDVTR